MRNGLHERINGRQSPNESLKSRIAADLWLIMVKSLAWIIMSPGGTSTSRCSSCIGEHYDVKVLFWLPMVLVSRKRDVHTRIYRAEEKRGSFRPV
jgi:hypothetical protein